MNKFIEIFVGLLFISTICDAQDYCVQEKVYLHLDSNFYYAGDTIWYAAYTVRADDNRPTDMSRILYVELLNEQGYQVERQQLVVDYDGRANGQFALPDTVFAGYYEVRAYTKWMMNFKDEDGLPYMFSRVMPVYQKNEPTQNYRRKMMPRKITAGNYEIKYPLPKLNVRFYPEGGHIVCGQECRVAFEVSNEQTRRLDIDGELLEDGKVIDTIRTMHNGRGMFMLFALSGKKYKTRFTLNGETYENEIKGIEDEGIAMKVVNGESMVDVTLAQSGQLFANDSLTARVLCRGELLMEALLKIDGEMREVHFPKEQMRDGVNEIVISDSKDNVVASRMVFINNTGRMSVKPSVQGASGAMNPYEKRSLVIDLGKQYANAVFSIAVTDGNQRNQSYDTGNIMTELLLQSDVRGFVDNAAWYFEKNSKERMDALDLLMMIQGWSRYDWGRAKESTRYDVEKTTVIHCELQEVGESFRARRRRRQTKAAFATLVMTDKRELYKGSIYADSTGRFAIAHEPFYGDATLYLTAFYKDKLEKSTKYSKKPHDPKIFIKVEGSHPINSLKQYSWYEMNEPDSLADKLPSVPDAIALNEVTVKDKNPVFIKRKNQPVAEYDFLDFINEFYDYSPNGKSIIGHEYPFVLFDTYLTKKVTNEYRNGHSLFTVYDNYFSGVVSTEADLKKKMSYGFIHRLDSVKVTADIPRRPSCATYVYPERLGTNQMTFSDGTTIKAIASKSLCGYKFYKKLPEGQERIVEGRKINLHGFNRPTEFYSPDYSAMPLLEQPDHRHTLYWNPAVRADSQGQARVTFCNNSACTDLHISMDGVTKDGRMIVYRNSIKVGSINYHRK